MTPYRTALRRILIIGALGACLGAQARPLVIEESQVLEPPLSAWSYLGESVAIEGDWALATALHSTDGTYNYPYQQLALLYRRSGDTWSFDHVLVNDTTDRVTWNDPKVAMQGGLAAVSTTPLRMYQRSAEQWTALPAPFSARPQDASWANGITRIDGGTVAAIAGRCRFGVVTSERAGDDWSTPRLVAGNARICSISNYSGSMDLDGNRMAFTNPQEDPSLPPSETRIYRRAAPGEAWQLDETLPGGEFGAGIALSGDQLFVGSWNPAGNEIYRRGADGWRPDGNLPTLLGYARTYQPAWHIGKGGGFVLVANSFSDEGSGGIAVYRQDANGAYQHVAQLVSSRGDSLGPVVEISGRTVITGGWTRDAPDHGRLYFFQLPADLAVPEVLQEDFEDGDASGWSLEAGSFTVARRGPSRVLRQSDSQAPAVAVLAASDTTNESVQADILPTRFDGEDAAVGLSTRHVNAANQYVAMLRASGAVELQRVQAGDSVTLAIRTLPVVAGRRYHLRLESVGSRHRVYVNGERMLDAADRALERGRVALLTAGAAADFDNVVVTPNQRTPLYTAEITAGGGCDEFLRARGLRESGTPRWDCSDADAGWLRQASLTGVARAVIGPETDDQVVESRIRLEAFNEGEGDEWLGVMTRYTDDQNYYYFVLRNSKVMSLRKLVDGRIVELGRANFTLGTGDWHTFRLEAVGNRLRGYVNGQLLIQAVDSDHPGGVSGIATYGAAALFDYLRVTQP